jgi:hydroxyethylthiazole kinase-like uncharacterized protein yjeF
MAIATSLFTTAQVRAIDARAIAALRDDGATLMRRAGAAAWRRLRARWPQAHRLLVACGRGNNGGDGWVLATLARAEGVDVEVVHLGGEPTTALARTMRDEALLAGVPARAFDPGLPLPAADLLVDGVFGISLRLAPIGEAAALIEALATHGAPLLALDVPSGLDADTGHAPGACVRAQLTVCFIAGKRGLYTGRAPDLAGDVVVESLDVDARLLDADGRAVHALARADLRALLPPRSATAHKGTAGHVLAIGGDVGYGGAVRLAGEAAARSGAGLVSVATNAEHVAPILAARPELMVQSVAGGADLAVMLARAGVFAVGPGLGQGSWGQSLLAQALGSDKPGVFDADALNLLARAPRLLAPGCVLTPHPGEAARLLDSSVAAVQADRFAAALALAQTFGAVAVLKGAGTVLAHPDGGLALCPVAEPGMASGGMGDVLTGVIAALMAQGLDAWHAAQAGVLAHALAASSAARRGGARGLLASDVIDALRGLLNP